MIADINAAARALAQAVNGIDWKAGDVQGAVDALHRLGRGAPIAGLDAAMAILIERLQQFRVDDADGIAHVAITAGSLIEFGASPQPLAEVLVDKLPAVLQAARRYANLCLADTRTPAEFPDDDEPDVFREVDQRPISREVFRDHLDADRPGGAALANLEQWVLAAITSWTRARDWLARAAQNQELVGLAEQMRESDAHWLRILLGAQLSATWLVLCPLERRGFRVLVDGVVSNYELHALLAAALVPAGIPGTASSQNIVAFLEGRAELPQKKPYVKGTWNLYDYRAAPFDLSAGDRVPLEYWVWGEGIPNDVPTLEGERTLLVGPASVSRSWNLHRVFSALPSRVTVIEELEANEFQRKLSAAMAACGPI